MEVTISESFEGSSVDVLEENGVKVGVIKDAKFLGLNSKNRRNYTEPACSKAVQDGLYNGLNVYTDHKLKGRSVTESIGVTKNARFVPGEGIRGDVHYDPADPVARKMAWQAANNPSGSGFSHHAVLTMRKQHGGNDIVEGIDKAKSLDWVTNPATNSSFFESEEPDMALEDIDLAELKKSRPDLVEALESEGQADKKVAELEAKLKAAKEAQEALEAEAELRKVAEEVESLLEDSEYEGHPQALKLVLAQHFEAEDDRKEFIAELDSYVKTQVENAKEGKDQEDETEEVKEPKRKKGSVKNTKTRFDADKLKSAFRGAK